MSELSTSEARKLMEVYTSMCAPQQENLSEEVEQLDEAPMTAFQAAGGNAKLAQLNKGLSPRSSARATPSTIERQGQQNLYKAGGGDAAIAQGPSRTQNVRGGGQIKVPTLTRQDIINRGTVAAAQKPTPAKDRPTPTPVKDRPTPTPAPAAAKPAPSAQTGDKAKDMATWAKANPTLANKPKTRNPLMDRTFGYQSGNAPDQIAKASAGAPPTPSGSSLGAAAKPEVRKALNLPIKPATPTQATAAAPSTSAAASGSVTGATARLAAAPKPVPMSPREKALNQSYEYDAYDLVLEYLLANGHVDSVDEAHYVMLEMGSETIQNIVSEQSNTLITPEQRRADELKYGAKRTTPVPPARPGGSKVKPGSRMPL